MLTYRVELTGRSPFLQDAYADGVSGWPPPETTAPKSKKKIAPREEAETKCHRDQDGLIVHPSSAILQMLEEAGKRIKVGRGTLKALIPVSVRMESEWVELYNPNGTRLSDFEVDVRYIPNGNGQRVKHTKARFDLWVAKFEMTIRDEVADPDLINQALIDAGQWVGLGSFRVQQKGPFGRFVVTKWEEIELEADEGVGHITSKVAVLDKGKAKARA